MIQWNEVTWYSKLLALLVIVGAFFGGVYFGTRHDEIRSLFPQKEGIACTADAKECPDGSYVGRTGPNCKFAACPIMPQENSYGTDIGAPDIPALQ